MSEEKKTSAYNYEADRRWIEKNPDRKRAIRKHSQARSFIRNDATLKDLDELEEIIRLRREAFPQKLDKNNEKI